MARISTKQITPFLWFDNDAEEAARFYASVFKDSKILAITRYTEAGKELHRRPPGSVMTVQFRIAGQQFTALNGGPVFKFSPAVSFVVSCRTQKEIDYYWKTLAKGGQEVECGWLTDKYGLSWQIVPEQLIAMFADKERAPRVMVAMLRMKKLDIAALKKAYAGR